MIRSSLYNRLVVGQKRRVVVLLSSFCCRLPRSLCRKATALTHLQGRKSKKSFVDTKDAILHKVYCLQMIVFMQSGTALTHLQRACLYATHTHSVPDTSRTARNILNCSSLCCCRLSLCKAVRAQLCDELVRLDAVAVARIESNNLGMSGISQHTA